MKIRRSVFTLFLAAILMLVSLAGCGSKEESLVKKITGTDPETTVLTINDSAISAELYYYWLSIVCEDVSAYYTDGIQWDEVLYDDVTVAQYVQNTALDTLIQYQIVTDLDEEYKLQDAEEVQAYLDEMIANNVESFGSEEAFNESLANSGVTRDTILYLYKTQYLYSDLQDKLYAAGGPLEVSDETVQEYIAQNYGAENGSYSAKHILFKTVDDTNTPLSDEEIAQKKTQAEDVLAQLRASSADPQALFDQLMAEYNEDTGEPAEGYTFGPGEMVDAFYNATAALEEYAISDLVESTYGYHIIMRLPSVIPTVEETKESYALELFSTLFQERVTGAQVEYAKDVTLMGPQEYYTEYSKGE
ncbi:MAG: peptidylprolyl isomerase [Oscillospiraceae bacterium]|nr:peptidylprolyl isomerase [Oscillospiraceae bacterium]